MSCGWGEGLERAQWSQGATVGAGLRPAPTSATIAILALALCAVPLAAQVRTTGMRELGVQAIATASDPAVGVVGLSGALRTGPRVRVAATAGAGLTEGEGGGSAFAWRGELAGHYLFSPGTALRTGFYAGAGVAATGGPDTRATRGWVMLLVGFEERPAAPAGWSVELGVGGGARLAVGYRWRWRGSR